jgi:hypothetical protein
MAFGVIAMGVGFLVGCGDATSGLRWERQPAYLEAFGPVRVSVPETMKVHVPGTVTVWTQSGMCDRRGETLVQTSSLLAVIQPFDTVPTGESRCAEGGVETQREVEIIFTEAGTARIRFMGLRRPGDSLITVERTSVVR